MSERVELLTSSASRSLARDNMVVLRVGSETATMTAGQWSRLISKPKRIEVALYPAGIDDLVP